MDDLDKKIEYSLFSPKTGRSLFYDYPELKDNPDLVHLKNDKRKLLFCYYLGCDTSPLKSYYVNTDIRSRRKAVEKALEHSGMRLREEQKRSYLMCEFPSDVKKGINGFLIYKANARIRMKLKMEKLLSNWEKIINKDIDSSIFNVLDKEGRDTGEQDFDKVKKYTDITISIKKQMSDTLREIEYGFGLTESEKADSESDDVSFTDLKHEGEI